MSQVFWVFVVVRGLLIAVAPLVAGGFSCCRARALGTWALVVVACGLSSCDVWALERKLSSCGARAYLLRGMWDLSGPGLEPVSPALAGGFLTTVPPGKSLVDFFFFVVYHFNSLLYFSVYFLVIFLVITLGIMLT